MNHNFAEYHVAVNADIHDIQVIFADEDDRVVSKQLGAKGVGEIGIVGVSAAVANAIFHATGKRLRTHADVAGQAAAGRTMGSNDEPCLPGITTDEKT
jgi:CO/xanthine dehydrogenase Mo-binding subunit